MSALANLGSSLKTGLKTAGERIRLGHDMLAAGTLTQGQYAAYLTDILGQMPPNERQAAHSSLPQNVQALLARYATEQGA